MSQALQMPSGWKKPAIAPELMPYVPPVARVEAQAETLLPAPTRVQALAASGSVPPPLDQLDDLALSLRTMPFDLFTEFAEAIGAKPANLWAWAKGRPMKA
jgi:hypothetical protein